MRTTPPTTCEKNYFTANSRTALEYAMVSMHISNKDCANWLWATFEQTEKMTDR